MARLVFAQTPSCRIDFRFDEKTPVLRIEGFVNEDINFGKVLNQLRDVLTPPASTHVEFLPTKINSCGVREWILFLQHLQASYSIRFAVVGEVAIEQASIVPNLLGKKGTLIDYFEIPYFCDSCKDRSVVLAPFHVVAAASELLKHPEHCEKCGATLQFDALAEDYFSFMKHNASGLAAPDSV